MEMDFSPSVIPQRVAYGGDASFTMNAGEKLKIKVQEGFILNETVPIGKQWQIHIHIDAEEKDA